MLMSTIQCRSLYLLIAALFFLGSRGAAQSTADQNFKTIPQQVKTNAEVKATNKAYKGFVGMFKKKKKKDSAGVMPPPPPGGTPPPPGGTPPPPGGTPPPPG